MAEPLEGLVVLDHSAMISGPYCTRLLADLGADVIKVEAPGGDHMRRLRPRTRGASRFFGQLNAGKRSVVLDLRHKAGRDAALELARGADVVIDNWRPGVADRLGVGYDDCRRVNGRIVHCSISGYGRAGRHADRAAFAPTIHAFSGFDLASMSYQPDHDRPPVTGVFVADFLGGALAFGAIMTALHRRAAEGVGSQVDVSMMEGMLSMLVYELQAAVAGLTERRITHPPVRTLDGHLSLTIVNDANWAATAAAIGRPELAADERFRDVSSRTRNWAELQAHVAAWAAGRTTAEAEARLLAAGAPAARYRSVGDILADPELRGGFRDVLDAAGPFPVPVTPFRLDEVATPAGGTRVPALGEHTREVLESVARLPPEEIDALFEAGAAVQLDARGDQ
ncbi:CaiB/BaiF CoA transferase family protein [Nonomuraea purpurea]|uniref:CaiB/BaiF CoA transferase family protein n=1 Tax=Nonomuraea purpurea TaxID=1849276 RepID=A0ABV8FZ15_9ACTN